MFLTFVGTKKILILGMETETEDKYMYKTYNVWIGINVLYCECILKNVVTYFGYTFNGNKLKPIPNCFVFSSFSHMQTFMYIRIYTPIVKHIENYYSQNYYIKIMLVHFS